MELKILNKQAKDAGKINLPVQFKEEVRLDLVKRAVLAIHANNRQRYGASMDAGKRASAYVSKRRRAYKTTYGIGQSRTPRKILSRSGTRMNWVGAVAPQTVGGRRAHPPKASKIWSQKVNIAENRKAIRSALSATMVSDLVKNRGHVIPSNFPFAISDDFLSINKTSELKKVLIDLGFEGELARAEVRKIRAGKGKVRGRKHKTRTSVLFVVKSDSELSRAANNLPGCDVVCAHNLNASILAPGAVPGRLTLFTESALKIIADKALFMNVAKQVVSVKKEKVKAESESKAQKKVAVKSVKKAVKKSTTKTKKDEGIKDE
ncbi:MAG: 50S ribosomal protein L4 [Candidatus Woesearchaeota archaeon]